MSVSINSKILSIYNVEVPVSKLKIGDKVWAIDLKNRKLCQTDIIDIIRNYETTYDININDLFVSDNQKMYIGNRGQRFKERSLRELFRKDANYCVRVWPFDRVRNFEKLNGDFERGYMRGFVEGDGNIGDRGIRVFQKDKTVIDEFFSLYNNYIDKCEVKTKYLPKTDMFMGAGGYTKTFLDKTDNFGSDEFIHGYLNGIIISDGCAAYNKSNDSFGVVITQSLDANAEKCETIQNCLDKLHYKYDKWESYAGGFRENGSHMISWRITRPYIIPLQYGTNKLLDVHFKIGEYGSLRNFKYTNIPAFKLMKTKNTETFNIKTSVGTYFCNGCLMACE